MAQPTALLGTGGDAPQPFRQRIDEMLVDLVQANDALQLLDQRDLTVHQALGLLGYAIESPEFLEELSISLQAQRILYAKARNVDGYIELTVTFYDVEEATYVLDELFHLNTHRDFVHMEAVLTSAVTGRAVLEVTSDYPEVEVSVDDGDFGMVPVVLVGLPPGQHTLTATCQHCETLTRSFPINEGRYHHQDIPMAPEGMESMEPTEAAPVFPVEEAVLLDQGDQPDLLLPVTITGVGVALLGTAVVFAVLTHSRQQELNSEISYSRAHELADEGERYALLTNIFLVSGVLVTVGGSVLFFVGNGRQEDPDHRSPPSTGQLSGWFSPEGAGLGINWTFY
ncbi:MAG: hypothetical protein JW797_15515 [Bradymonadales bacterium]|nr:hypothetical protein [Bradymonadales bacterium]